MAGPDSQDGAAAAVTKAQRTPRTTDKPRDNTRKKQLKAPVKEQYRDILYYTQKLHGPADEEAGGTASRGEDADLFTQAE